MSLKMGGSWNDHELCDACCRALSKWLVGITVEGLADAVGASRQKCHKPLFQDQMTSIYVNETCLLLYM